MAASGTMQAEDPWGDEAQRLVAELDACRRERDEALRRAEGFEEWRRSEGALTESRERLSLAMDATGLGMFEFDPRSGEHQATPRARQHFGLSPDVDTKLGSDMFFAALHPEDRERVRALVQRVLLPESGGEYHTEYRTIGVEDGKERWVDAWGRVFFDAEGKAIRFIGTTLDITERKRAEARLHLLAEQGAALAAATTEEDALRGTVDVAVAGYADHCFVDLAEGGDFRRAAVASADARRQELAEGVRPDGPRRAALDRIPEMARVLRDGQPLLIAQITTATLRAFARDRRHLRALRALQPASAVIVPLVARDRLLGGISLVRTAQRAPFDEEDLQTAELFGRRAALALDNIRLYEAEQRARTEAQEANQAKDQFVALVSHELRNPLAAITAGIDVLRRSLPHEGRVWRSVEIVERNARLQARLVSDLLDLSRLQRGKLQLQLGPVELGRVADAAVGSYESEAQEAGLTLTVDIAPGLWVLGDPDRLQQVVMNLLSNATKFTPAGGEIGVRVWVCEGVGDGRPETARGAEDGGLATAGGEGTPPPPHTPTHPYAPTPTHSACLSVRDTGIGIDQELLGHLFTMFEQGEVAGQRRPGLGIGLALVKGIVERHGGWVRAESDGVGKGSCFTVELPLIEGPALRPAPREAGEGEPKPTRVLVIEDNPDTRSVLADSLTLAGYDVQTAGSGEEGLEVLREGSPQVMLVDIGLPGMDGFEFLRRARELPGMGDVPAFAVTGYGSEKDVRRGREAGFAGHFVKPVDVHALDGRIREWVAG